MLSVFSLCLSSSYLLLTAVFPLYVPLFPLLQLSSFNINMFWNSPVKEDYLLDKTIHKGHI